MFEPAVRLRLRLGQGAWRGEIEGLGGVRLSLTDVLDHHFAAGLGAVLYAREFGIGVHYARALSDDALTHTVLVKVERSTPLDPDESAWGSGRAADEVPRVGLGLHLLGTGWGFADGLGIMMPGVAIELPAYFGLPLIPVVRWDVLWFVGIDGPAVTLQSALAGLQYYEVASLPFGLSALGGYSIAYGDAPRVADAGPVGDVGAWYWLDDQGTHLGVHGRAGLVEDNRELRVVYLSLGGREIF